MRRDEITGDPQRFTEDPPRDRQLASLLTQYEASSAPSLDPAFRQRLSLAVAVAMQDRRADRWYTALGRLSRLAVPMGLAAAAALAVLITRQAEPPASLAAPMMMSVASGAVSPSDLAELLSVTQRCEVDLMCGAFGRVGVE